MTAPTVPHRTGGSVPDQGPPRTAAPARSAALAPPRRGGPGTWLASLDPAVVDATWVVPLAVASGLDASGTALGRVLGLVAVVEVGGLVVRRRSPVASVVVVFTAALAHWLLSTLFIPATSTPLLLADVAVLAALYSAAVHGPRWARWTALGGAAVGAVLMGVSVAVASVHEGGGLTIGLVADAATVTVGVFVVALLAWTAGQLRRVRLAQLAATLESARRAQAVSAQQALVAAGEERARIARELHDVVAHSLSVVIAQADGGRYAAASDPDAAARALETVAATGRSALTDMRRLLGVLREGEGGAAMAPQPGVGDLAALVGSVRASGLDVVLTRVGEPRPLVPSAGLALYRGVQESLTNVLKHAGPGAWARVGLTWRQDGVQLRVDDGGGTGAMVASSGDGAGRGLLGMRERLALHGGTVVAGPREGGGFSVRIDLPLGRAS